MGGFSHKTLCQVACKIPVETAVAAVLVECQALINLLPCVAAKEVEVEVVGYLICIHKEFPQPSNQLIGHIDLMVDLPKNEVGEGVVKQMQVVIDWLETQLACQLTVQVVHLPVMAVA